MNFYDIGMSPIEFAFLNKMRKSIVPLARGNVLEIGFGTGANVHLYDRKKVSSLSAIDVKFTQETLKKFSDKVTLIEAGAEKIPFADNSFDAVVCTIALCSVENLEQSIQEIKRVLKDGGSYLFVEHVLPANKHLAKAFNKLNKTWHKHMGGCNINRQAVEALLDHGFTILNNNKKNFKIFTYGIAINNK